MDWLSINKETLFAVHLGVSLALAGIVLFVQLVHYPSFKVLLGEGDVFVDYHRHYSHFAGRFLGPLMVLELVTAIMLLFTPWALFYGQLFWLNLALIQVVWAITFFHTGPCHHKLIKNPDEKQLNKLLVSNVLRSFLWVGRVVILLSFMD